MNFAILVLSTGFLFGFATFLGGVRVLKSPSGVRWAGWAFLLVGGGIALISAALLGAGLVAGNVILWN